MLAVYRIHVQDQGPNHPTTRPRPEKDSLKPYVVGSAGWAISVLTSERLLGE